ncbi:MAG: 23S rRNA (uracil(1939)-C(5))-methyltransferase RlmD [Magnetococcales bacterium]|nr:23S rRNA (uracil(1939)-C(5))-methyltransferase RlmD [Magnetococcales bacterium]
MEVIDVQVERLIAGGIGLAHWQGMAVLVPFAVPGDRLTVTVQQRGNRFIRGEIQSIAQAGEGRCEPLCPYYGQCGGCDLQHMEAATALQGKRDILVDALARIGGVREESLIAPPLAAPTVWGYRRRAGFKVRQLADGRAVVGFYQRQSHWLVDVDSCPALHPALNQLLSPLRQLIAGMEGGNRIPQIDAVSGEEGCGLVVHMLVPPSASDRKKLLAFAKEQNIVQLWLQQGRKSGLQALRQETELYYSLPPFAMGFHPADFVQAHFEQNQQLVALAMEHCQRGEGALDLYCGVGNFSLPLAERFNKVVGVEGYQAALLRAGSTAKRYGLPHLEFRALDLANPENLSTLPEGLDTVLLDPPREGAVAVARWLAAGKVTRVVYVSCDPASLARDAAILGQGGFVLKQATPVDMFPQTHHVETVACFERDQ